MTATPIGDPRDAVGPAGNRAERENNLQGYPKSTVPTLGPAAQRVLDAHRERPWPSLDAFIAYGNRRAQLARWASHLARVAQAPECTSRDVEAAVGRLLPLLQAVSR